MVAKKRRHGCQCCGRWGRTSGAWCSSSSVTSTGTTLSDLSLRMPHGSVGETFENFRDVLMMLLIPKDLVGDIKLKNYHLIAF